MNRDRIGLSIASLLPWSAIPVIGLKIAARMTKRAGYSFWQVLPLRSATATSLKATGIPVRFAEQAWNATTFIAHFRGKPGAEGAPTKLHDPLFFPNPKGCDRRFAQIRQIPGVKLISHHLAEMSEGWLVEIHPGLQRSVSELKAIVTEAEWRPYVIDLRHLRRFADGFGFSEWQQALGTLLPFTSLIHIQAKSSLEWLGFLRGRKVELAQMLIFIKDWGYDGPFITEFKPLIMGSTDLLPSNMTSNFWRAWGRIKSYLD